MNLTDKQVEELISDKKTFVIDFKAEWCSPCKIVSPIIERLSKKYENQIIIGKLDVDENNLIPRLFNVRNIPTILFIKNGEVIDRQVGMVSEQILEEKIQNILNE